MHGHTPANRRQAAPEDLQALLDAPDEGAREEAWARFVAGHSRLILKVARTASPGHDDTMDRYTFILDRLRQDDYRRLRAYIADGRARFTTWLTVVVRRLCMDHHRQRYGRHRRDEERGMEAEVTRRRLVDLVGEAVEVDALRDDGRDPEMGLRVKEFRAALEGALAELEPRDRLLLAMRYEDGRSARVVAEVMGFASPFHVYRRAEKVLRELRSALLERGIHEPVP